MKTIIEESNFTIGGNEVSTLENSNSYVSTFSTGSTVFVNYGYLYNWYCVFTGKLAPGGYRVAYDHDFRNLMDHLGNTTPHSSGYQTEFHQIRSVRDSEYDYPRWNSVVPGTSDIYKLNFLPGGGRQVTGLFESDVFTLQMWTLSGNVSYPYTSGDPEDPNTPTDPMYTPRRRVVYDMELWSDNFLYWGVSWIYGASIRCVRDASAEEQLLEDGTFLDIVTDADGNKYRTVKIDNLVWFASNLYTTKYNDGEEIPNITDNTEWSGLDSGAYCSYENIPLSERQYEDSISEGAINIIPISENALTYEIQLQEINDTIRIGSYGLLSFENSTTQEYNNKLKVYRIDYDNKIIYVKSNKKILDYIITDNTKITWGTDIKKSDKISHECPKNIYITNVLNDSINLGKKQISLYWDFNIEDLEYIIAYRKLIDTNNANWNYVSSVGNNVLIQNLSIDTKYAFTVMSIRESGTSEYSNEILLQL
jgi:hypothetical protein